MGNFDFRPEKAALLVIDMQDYFTTEKSHAFVPDAPQIIKNIKRLTKAFKEIERPIIYTRHIDVDPENTMSRWWKDNICEKDPLSLIHKDLDSDPGSVLVKHQYDAFLNTDLEERLKKNSTGQIVITGVVTHLCCETTARSAFMRNFETFFVTDATGDYEEEYAKATLLNLSHGFAVPMTSKKLLASF